MNVEWIYREANNFSYENIARPLTIPINQQMIVVDWLEINDELTINGTLVLI